MTSSPFADRHPLKEKRKANKPLLERKRRARINDSLTELKQLVLFSLNKDTSRYSKMEKADILDMTVQFLRSKKIRPSKEAAAPTSYQAGFNECANEIIRFVMTMEEIDHALKARLLSHLASSCQSVDPAQMMSADIAPIPASPMMWSSHCLPPSPNDVPSPTNSNTSSGGGSFPLQATIVIDSGRHHHTGGVKPLAPHPRRMAGTAFPKHAHSIHEHASSGGKPRRQRATLKLERGDATTEFVDFGTKPFVWRPW